MRGNHYVLHRRFEDMRSIPACAGEPCKSPGRSPIRWVYPRVCGGTPAGSCDCEADNGLSPRVRGNRVQANLRSRRTGSIPACAGEPGISNSAIMSAWVYPRVCGGTRGNVIGPDGPTGLSPRVRGNLELEVFGLPWSGSIPACAGEPLCRDTPGSLATVYPRVCGGT